MRHRITLEGVVQGVGFRPLVKTLADRLAVRGVTFNTAAGLVVEIDLPDELDADAFIEALLTGAPPAARIDSYAVKKVCQDGKFEGFRILASPPRDGSFTLISPDLATCQKCKREIEDPRDRRFKYPFTNCTNCGPRYSITLSTPYDRVNTTMARFQMCPHCATEYADPANRRFHAEPTACPLCGPQLSMDLAEAIAVLEAGQILGLKGLGGFQLACDAFCTRTVLELRVRKRRSRKPFAVMMRDLATVENYCEVNDSERRLMEGPSAPVVLLAMKANASFAPEVAPGLRQLGVMLPYTPLHHLLFSGSVTSMVMTSGNISEEPIVVRNEDAVRKLSSLADRLLMHNRDIFMRVDDSVARTFEDVPRIQRRARGYAPGAIALAHNAGEILATGAELKSAFCITKGRYAVLSQHIGDMQNYETLQFFEEALLNLQGVYQAKPQLIVHDLHPDYLTTRWALARSEPKIAVQHHHAHIASCMAENHVEERVIGVAFDGTGFGADGQVWGGEFLVSDYHGYQRLAHLRYVALPGGDRTAREGWRMAASHLYDALGQSFRNLGLPVWDATSHRSWKLIERLIERPEIRTSSCGRLFDAVSAICGISTESSYEGESAMLLEAAASGSKGQRYEIPLDTRTVPWTVDTRPMIRQIAEEVAGGQTAANIAHCFHESIADMIESVCSTIRERNGVENVCLSGGVFQNFTLLSAAAVRLRRSGFRVFLHSKVPPNDGGVSLGQAVIGAAFLERTSSNVSRDSWQNQCTE